MLQWVAISFSRGSSQSRGWTLISCISHIGRWIFYHLSHLGSPRNKNRKYLLCGVGGWKIRVNSLGGLEVISFSCLLLNRRKTRLITVATWRHPLGVIIVSLKLLLSWPWWGDWPKVWELCSAGSLPSPDPWREDPVSAFLILDKLVIISSVSLSASISRRSPGENFVRKCVSVLLKYQ